MSGSNGMNLWEVSNVAQRNHIARLTGMEEETASACPIMPEGRYQGDLLDEIPEGYLIEAYHRGWLDIHPEVSEWVVNNLIKEEAE
ncbi:MAG: hypothetical protein RIC57_09065 [Balneola sp.]